MSQAYRHLFGPVRSRRLGLSLGIDLVPFKVCSFDCPYCQVGRTTSRTLERREYVSAADVLGEFDHWLAHDGKADHLTLAGAGEPTLHIGFGAILKALAARSRIPRVLLSNGSLFHEPAVRAEASGANIVKGTLAAWDQDSFVAAHRPHAALTFDVFYEGLKAMRAAFKGELWIEVFLIPGVNDAAAQVARIAALARDVGPDRIHLNTAVRPPQSGAVQAVPPARLAELAALFTPVAELSVAPPAPAPGANAGAGTGAGLEARILALIQRHPCTAADAALALGVPRDEADQALGGLAGRGAVRVETRAGTRFYVAG